jgi:hypothetical protein
MSNLLLEPSEVEGLTSRVRPNAQVRALRDMGIEHKVRPDGSVVVLRDAVNNALGGSTTATRRRSGPVGPDWTAI